MSPVVMPEERRDSPAQPPAHAHTPWSSTWRSWPCRGAVPQPAPLPRQRGMPQLPQTPATPFGGDADTERGTDRKQSPSGVSPASPAPAGGLAAPNPVSPDTYSQSLEAPAAATYQHVPLHFSRLKHCLFLHLCRVCACVCCSPRVT